MNALNEVIYSCMDETLRKQCYKREVLIKIKDMDDCDVETDENVVDAFDSEDVHFIVNVNDPLMKKQVENDALPKKQVENDPPTKMQVEYDPLPKKQVKNALVVMVGISEYQNPYHHLENVKNKDVKNFRRVFEEEFKYKFVCTSNFITKSDLQDFFEIEVIYKHQLRKNTNKYDALIIIICGHGENNNSLVTSDGKQISIESIANEFNCESLESMMDCPKIFFLLTFAVRLEWMKLLIKMIMK